MRVSILLLAAGSLAAQTARFGAGLQFAVPFNGMFQEVSGREFASDHSAHWMLGPEVHWRAPGRIAVGFSALYRQAGRDGGGGYFSYSERERGYSWEFPLLARFRVAQGPLRPFLTAGPSVLLVRTHSDADYIIGPSSSDRGSSHSTYAQARAGLAAGGGVEHRFGKALLTVEVRYSRWFTGTCYANELRCLAPNRGAAIVGIGF
jgi:hypothetical protein